ncbi:MAG: inorganic phosphate transporter [Wenzhouxiangellaceae bacterium]
MDSSYLIIIYLLLGLAVLDLMVGVSNDAVNFLNSAFGSKVAARRTILIIASLGILAGAMLSSGMMEVARKGIFHPEMFTFADIVVVFVAVMLADVLLLDTFNTFGMPTSTTVSIVFELLGAAVAVALFHVMSDTNGSTAIGQYINSDSAVLIISGIVLSVAVAFIVGALVQFLSRLVFTFQGGRGNTLTVLVWSAVAVTVMFFFILLKGLKGAAFLDKETINSITAQPLPIASAVFVGCLLFGAILQYQFKVNLLKIVVLIGTFSLALAFASNDLVNFIGVPLAGLHSYQSWAGSGVEADAFNMTALAEPIRGQSSLLFIAGFIMVVTLWLSEKARSVTETEISLGRQSEGEERFEPHPLSRGVVRFFLQMSKATQWLFPRRTAMWVEQRYARGTQSSIPSNPNEPAFDLVRASINLTVASILIAIATTMKLPLSTTYVTFMVAMGTSLADRAWGRDSAVYRVAGVINVIGGWFATAALAFTVAAVYAMLIKLFDGFAIAALVLVAIFALVHTHRLHKNRRSTRIMVDRVDLWNLRTTVEQVHQVVHSAIRGLVSDDQNGFGGTKKLTKKLWLHLQDVEVQLVKHLRLSTDENMEATRERLNLFSMEQNLYQSAHLISKACKDYVRNAHSPLDDTQRQRLQELLNSFSQFIRYTVTTDAREQPLINTSEFTDELEIALQDQVGGLRDGQYSQRNSRLLLSLYLELQDIVETLEQMHRLSASLHTNGDAIAEETETDEPAAASPPADQTTTQTANQADGAQERQTPNPQGPLNSPTG